MQQKRNQYSVIMPPSGYIYVPNLKRRRGKKLEERVRTEMGKKFAQLRLDYRPRISQQNLADAIGAPRNTIALIEVGKREPSLEMLIKLSKFFGKKPITDIFIGEDIPDFAGSDATLS